MTRNIYFFENKETFLKRFSNYIGRTWISTQGLTFPEFSEFIQNKDKIIYKPIYEAQGVGIIVFDNLTDSQLIYNEIISLNQDAVLEEWIIQNEELDKIYSDAINCLRLITIYKDGKTTILTGGITWGNGKKIANASASGIVSPVNLQTGMLEKPAADFSGKEYTNHPITGENLLNLKIPFWVETVNMINNAASEIPEVGYIGWDIAISDKGPIIIEGNTEPGYKYYQIPCHLTDGIGNKEIYSSFL